MPLFYFNIFCCLLQVTQPERTFPESCPGLSMQARTGNIAEIKWQNMGLA